MAQDIISQAYPKMLLWGQLTHMKARKMWRLRLRKFVKFGRCARDGGFATSVANCLNVTVVSILLIKGY
jgi:hypothetical protein